ncbi:MAG TPA: sigma-70 family RNA polymerase sigma factor [Dehalococcoidia bacterium]
MDSALIEESEALARAAAGEGAPFGVLVERYQEAAFRTAYLIVRDAATAEDVAQEAFIRAYRRIGSFRQGEPFRPWLLRIVVNLALNETRSRGRRLGLVARAGAMAPRSAESPHREVAAADEASTLLRAINELPDDDRVVLYLRFFVELSEREIAAAIAKPQGTVKSRLHRASGRLRELIERKYPSLKEHANA